MTMSDTSPTQAAHLAYAQQVTPSHSHLAGMPDSAGTARSYSGESASNAPDTPGHGSVGHGHAHAHASGNPAPHPPTKGKNGATGPAEGKTKPHICAICQRGFTTGGHLQRHGRIHTGVKAFKCPYPGCETRTSRQDNLQQHYRTHLSPTLRRGSGTAARQAIAAAMMAAGLKSTSARQPRKSKASGAGTPTSSSGASGGVHVPSPYATPTSAGAPPYGQQYMYGDPQAPYGGYPPLPPPGAMPTASAQSSRVPSPVSAGHPGVPPPMGAHHQPFYAPPAQFQQYAPYPPYPQPPQAYRYGGPGTMAPAYSHPAHHGVYSPGLAQDQHGHLYSPLQTGFPQHSRESSYGGGVLTPGSYATQQQPLAYPPRGQTSTPLSNVDDLGDSRYRRPGAGAGPGAGADGRAPSPGGGGGRRRSPPGHAQHAAPHDMLGAGVVDPAHMGHMQPGHAYAYGQPHHVPAYAYGAPPQSMAPHAARDGAPLPPPGGMMGHRASISSLSEDGSGNGVSDKLH
ncbi:transcriptional repressor [Cryptotrichosporon argae]